MITDEERDTLLAIASAEAADFVQLARIAGLDPATSFRDADLRGVDFVGCDLRGFDFSGTDLTGASFVGASLAGARFDRSTRGRPVGRVLDPVSSQPGRPRPLNALQQRVLDAMLLDMRNLGRALAILPLGLGRSAVLGELVDGLMRPRDRAALIVTSAAERDHLMGLLRQRLPSISIISSRQAVADSGWSGLMVHVASAYDSELSLFMEATHRHLDLLVATSLERLQGVLRAAEGTMDHVGIAAFDMPFLGGIGPEPTRLGRLADEMFGKPSVQIGIEESVKSGFLMPAHLIQPFAPHPFPRAITRYSGAYPRETPEVLYEMLAPVAVQIMEAGRALGIEPLLVLCRDAAQSQAMHRLLIDRSPRGHDVRRASQRWPAARIVDDVAANGGIVVVASSRHSIDAARRLGGVAIATPLRIALAQDIAFRVPDLFRDGDYPVVLDFAGAFRGFPGLEYGLPVRSDRQRPRA